ncbi:AEC family transporter [Geitlerinema sp. PCC 9228]|jgi:hypothetical protein|uniref:AEC family transporter n=1 Tax=Geitlerinema sp. PCC 9228 TaxID=111611 RepID=UPI0008F9A49F|nr:AEC family transporter [Geitlerinema sp. PCC 9228]
MTVLLPAIAPVALIIGIGFIAGKTMSLHRQTLSQLAIYILTPALIGSKLYRTTLSPDSAMGLAAGMLVSSVLLYLLVFFLSLFLDFPVTIRKSLIACTLFANTGNLGLPLLAFAFGDAGLERAVVYLVVAAVFMVVVGPALLKGHGWHSGVQLVLKLPLLWAAIAGLVARLLQLSFPLQIDEGIRMLGNAAIPVALLILGMQLSDTRLRLGKYELLACGLRLLVAPAIAFLVGLALQLQGLDLQVLVMQGAMPTAVNTLVLVTEFGGDADLVARTIVASTLFAFATLPVVLWLCS